MPGLNPPTPGSLPASVMAVSLLARGRASGLALLSGTRQGLLSAMAPLIAFPLVGSLATLMKGGPLDAVTDLVRFYDALLASLVLSFELARFWGKGAAWLRYATAVCLCQCALPVVLALMLLCLLPAITFGLNPEAASLMLGGCLGAYGLWLGWFLAWRGLGLSAGRAALLVLATDAGTVALLIGVQWAAKGLSG